MEQCSSSARHPTSRRSPRLAGGGTVLTKGLRLRPLVPSGAHPPAGRTASLPHRRPTASPLARSSLPPTLTAWDGQAADRRLRALQLDPGSGRMVPVTRVGRSALRAAAPAGRGHCRAAHQRMKLLCSSSRGLLLSDPGSPRRLIRGVSGQLLGATRCRRSASATTRRWLTSLWPCTLTVTSVPC
jgi:hypothetical protein